jgi:hypothetical protein
LIRGWDEVIKYLDKKGKRESVLSRESTEKVSPTSQNESPKKTESPTKMDVEMDEDEEDRVIEHLVFVIHGYYISVALILESDKSWVKEWKE